ncbi:MAG: hypothetical protein Q9159_000330 [Coniocarpon cinnabarinum]
MLFFVLLTLFLAGFGIAAAVPEEMKKEAQPNCKGSSKCKKAPVGSDVIGHLKDAVSYQLRMYNNTQLDVYYWKSQIACYKPNGSNTYCALWQNGGKKGEFAGYLYQAMGYFEVLLESSCETCGSAPVDQTDHGEFTVNFVTEGCGMRTGDGAGVCIPDLGYEPHH